MELSQTPTSQFHYYDNSIPHLQPPPPPNLPPSYTTKPLPQTTPSTLLDSIHTELSKIVKIVGCEGRGEWRDVKRRLGRFRVVVEEIWGEEGDGMMLDDYADC